jgi:CRP-like cAMP-binding protein
MASASYFANGNRLLRSLSASDRELLEPNLTPVSLRLRQDLERPNKPIELVIFPENAVASVVAVPMRDVEVEVGIIGCEGMSGTAIVAASDRSPHSTYIQVAGKARQISARNLTRALAESRTLRPQLVKFVHAFSIQAAHTAVANARARLDIRLARWLLMAHDRVPGNRLALTHELLSVMLASRRAGVTEALQTLRDQKLISARRGEITILDRKRLEKTADKFYGVPESEYRRILN